MISGLLRRLKILMICSVVKIESDRSLEIELDCTALVISTKGIVELDVDLRSVEGTISRVLLPSESLLLSAELIKRLLKLVLSCVPDAFVSEVRFGSCGEVEIVLETIDSIDVINEVKSSRDLLLDLIVSTEDMGIILLESSDSCETGKGTMDLISVEDTEV